MKKTKKNRLTVLIICAAVLALLCGVLAIVRQKASDYEDAQSAENSKSVFDITADKMTAVSYTTSDGTELKFTRNKDKKWTDESGNVLDQTKVGALASSFTGVKLTSKISDVKDLSEYGLDKPAYTCTFTDSDKKTTKFYIGSTNDSANVVYLYIDGDTSTVYAVSTGITSEISSKTSYDDYKPDSTASANSASTDSVSEASSTS